MSSQTSSKLKRNLVFCCFIWLLSTLSTHVYSQIAFEKGYFIDNSGTRVDCKIKNKGWLNNPSDFEYQIEENGEVKVGTIKTTTEFGIEGKYKFVRQTVQMDQSSNNVKKLSYDRKPVFKKQTVFLKVLLEGKASLYVYQSKIGIKYFYAKNNSPAEPLIYKRYLTNEGGLIENETYIQQLWNELKCEGQTLASFKNFQYVESVLLGQFKQYNQCNSTEYITYSTKDKKFKQRVTFALRPGVNISSAEGFSTEASFRLGLEGEIILPFFNNKLSLTIEPTYQRYQGIPDNTRTAGIAAFDYESLEWPIGVRYYSFLGKKSKLFFNGGVLLDLPFSQPELDFSANLFIGAGYQYNNRWSLEFRTGTNRDLTNRNFVNSLLFGSESIILGYKLSK